jgi:AcrR family transcriptional regulator
VALATLYSWFAGKNLLILAVMADWIDDIVDEVAAEPIEDETPSGRLEATLLRTVNLALERPNLLRSCLQAFSSPDPMGIEIVGRIEFSFGQLLFGQLGDDIDFDYRLDVARVVGGVWFAALMAWMCERRDEEHVRVMLRSAIAVALGRLDD